MLYIPKNGHMWDTSIFFYEDKYYLFSLFNYFNKECVNVWCAVSEDGVHFRDVGTVISDQPSLVWKMFVHRYGCRFVMNYGSFSNMEGHGNDTLRFWTSEDLIHWKYCGSEQDAHPNSQWYCEDQRFDHMYTVDYNGKYYGFAIANPKGGRDVSGFGLMESSDGVAWTALPPPVIE